VQRIAASIPAAAADAASEQYLKVLELGYTNNPEAIPLLVRLIERKEVLMRASAISALGMLRAKDQFPLLETLYETSSDLAKAMALKSIGDLDTPEGHDFVRAVKASKDYADETIREVADLY
jgi:HEAT repeat protein